jgi:hypothetical protein
MRWFAWAIGVAVVVIMALVFCCKRRSVRDSCDMENVTRDD